jgi:NADPH-dependent 2,4-dienoyl-CoA reductase/sulfur reductase-like enzyme
MRLVIVGGTDAGISAGLRARELDRSHQLLDKPVYMPLGSTAHKQGRVAGENASGGSADFAGSLGTQVVKVFDLAITATGKAVALGDAAQRDRALVDIAGRRKSVSGIVLELAIDLVAEEDQSTRAHQLADSLEGRCVHQRPGWIVRLVEIKQARMRSQ